LSKFEIMIFNDN